MSQHQRPPKKSSSPEYRSVKMGSSRRTTSLPSELRSPFQQDSKHHASMVMNHTTEVDWAKKGSIVSSSSSSKGIYHLCSPLPSVPAGYMFERNQIHVDANSINSSPQDVANRVAEALRLRSFTVTETSNDIKNAIRAESHNGLLFRVNFFLQDGTNKKMIVEFQRLAGCSYEFQCAYRAVHRGIMNQDEANQEEIEHELQFPTCVPKDRSRSERLVDTFAIALDLMQSEQRIDSQLMGLECMESLSMNAEILPLLFQEDCLNTLLQFCAPPTYEEALSQLEQQQDCLLKRRTLSILANALKVAPNLNSIDSYRILQTLLECLHRDTCGDAHQLFQVARCFVELYNKEEDAAASKSHALLLQKSQVLPKLRTTTINRHHLALEQECQKLEAILSSYDS